MKIAFNKFNCFSTILENQHSTGNNNKIDKFINKI